MKNLFVPKHFTFKELTKTSTGFSNNPTEFVHVQNLILLGAVLDYIRHEVELPITVNSAYRTPLVNKAVDGASKSYHMVGLAADICCPQMLDLSIVLHGMKQDGWFLELINHDTYFHIAINQVVAYTLLKDVLNNTIN